MSAWGYGSFGALGNGTTADSLVPASVPGLTAVSAAASGGDTGYALTR